MCALGDALAGGVRDHIAGRITRKSSWQACASNPLVGDDVNDVTNTCDGQGDRDEVIGVIGEILWSNGTALK
jgi:hypothetical protein